jgi:hypothetical protein
VPEEVGQKVRKIARRQQCLGLRFIHTSKQDIRRTKLGGAWRTEGHDGTQNIYCVRPVNNLLRAGSTSTVVGKQGCTLREDRPRQSATKCTGLRGGSSASIFTSTVRGASSRSACMPLQPGFKTGTKKAERNGVATRGEDGAREGSVSAQYKAGNAPIPLRSPKTSKQANKAGDIQIRNNRTGRMDARGRRW